MFKTGQKVKIVDAMNGKYIGMIGQIEEISDHCPLCCKLFIQGKKGSWANAWLFSCIRELTDEEEKEENIKQQAWNNGVCFGN